MTDEYREYYKRLPAYEEGGKKLPPNVKTLPQFTPGTPEYAKYQNQISGRAEAVQPEAYLTPAGYVKDAVNFVEDISNSDYSGAAIDAVLNVIPWGVGKTLKGIKKKISKVNGVTGDISLDSTAEPFQQTITKRKGKKSNKPSPEAEDAEMYKQMRNRSKYDSEISRSIDDAIFPDDDTYKLLNEVDATYGTEYKRAYRDIAMRDMTNRGKYLKWGTNDKGALGSISAPLSADGSIPRDISKYSLILNPDEFVSGTANHELGHIADGLAGSTRYRVGPDEYNITNPYLRYLANPSNALEEGQLRKMGLHSAANNRKYLLNPTEAKSHMLTLKRALKDSGDIINWSSPVTEKMVTNYFKRSGSNKMIENQYNLYKNKSEYIDRINKLVPMGILMPIGAAGGSYELNKE